MSTRNSNRKEQNFFKNFQNNENNFFLQNEQVPIVFDTQIHSGRHLNDYDFNILQENSYKNLQNEILKLEYKINKIEEEIRSIDEQILIAREMKDFSAIEWLYERKKKLVIELEETTDIYNKASISARFSDGLTNIVSPSLKSRFSIVRKFFNFLLENFISKFPSQYSSFLELKNNLKKLEVIHRSVNELMTVQAPYGEVENRYEQISKYIKKANDIQAKLYKDLQNK